MSAPEQTHRHEIRHADRIFHQETNPLVLAYQLYTRARTKSLTTGEGVTRARQRDGATCIGVKLRSVQSRVGGDHLSRFEQGELRAVAPPAQAKRRMVDPFTIRGYDAARGLLSSAEREGADDTVGVGGVHVGGGESDAESA